MSLNIIHTALRWSISINTLGLNAIIIISNGLKKVEELTHFGVNTVYIIQILTGSSMTWKINL